MQQKTFHSAQAEVLHEHEKINEASLTPVQRASAEKLNLSLQAAPPPESPRHAERQEVKETTRTSLLDLTQQMFYPLLGLG